VENKKFYAYMMITWWNTNKKGWQ